MGSSEVTVSQSLEWWGRVPAGPLPALLQERARSRLAELFLVAGQAKHFTSNIARQDYKG